MLIVFIFRTFR